LAYLGHGTVAEINGIYGSLGIILQESEVISELKLWEKGLKLWLFTLRVEVCVQDQEEMCHYCHDAYTLMKRPRMLT